MIPVHCTRLETLGPEQGYCRRQLNCRIQNIFKSEEGNEPVGKNNGTIFKAMSLCGGEIKCMHESSQTRGPNLSNSLVKCLITAWPILTLMASFKCSIS